MAVDYIECMKENADWGEYLYPAGKTLEWVWYKYPVDDEVMDMFISDYIHGTQYFFYGNPPKSIIGELDTEYWKYGSKKEDK